MRMLNDSPTKAVDASAPAPPPLLTPAAAAGMVSEGLQKAAASRWSERELVARIPSSLLIAALVALACILCRILTFVLDGGRTEDAAAPPPPPHAAAAAAAAGGRPAATDACLQKRGLRKIPVVVYEAKPGASASATDGCVICLGEFHDGEKVCELPRCHHGFHVLCIDQWLAKHPSCPTCRDSLRI